MKFNKGLITPVLAYGLLAGMANTGQALSFTTFVDNTPPPTNDYATVGAKTSAPPIFTNRLASDNGGGGVSAESPSVVTFGVTSTNGPSGPNVIGTFDGGPNSQVSFTFDLANGNFDGDLAPTPGTYDSFLITGTLTGQVGYGPTGSSFSTTKITFNSITNTNPGLGDDLTSVLTTNPNNGLPALLIRSTAGGQPFDIYLNAVQDISKPGPQLLSISGFIRTSAVPEPGSVALIIGFGVSGGIFLRKRRN